jgi:hypothetical protein
MKVIKWHKGCRWYFGTSGTPNLKLCKTCVRKVECVGRNYLKYSKLKIKDLL